MTLDETLTQGIKSRAKGFDFLANARRQHLQGAGVYSTYDARNKIAQIGREVAPEIEHNYLEGEVVPHLFDAAVTQLTKSCRNFLETKITSENIIDVFRGIKAGTLDKVALSLALKDGEIDSRYAPAEEARRQYAKYAEMLQNQDLKGYVESIKSEAAKEIMAAFVKVNPELALTRLKGRVIGMQNAFLGQFKKADGKRDTDKLAEYLAEIYNASDEDTRKEINVQAGIAYAGIESREE